MFEHHRRSVVGESGVEKAARRRLSFEKHNSSVIALHGHIFSMPRSNESIEGRGRKGVLERSFSPLNLAPLQ